MTSPVTLWYVLDRESASYSLNHIEDGSICGSYPLPKDPAFANQKAWKGQAWLHVHGVLDRDYRVHEVCPLEAA